MSSPGPSFAPAAGGVAEAHAARYDAFQLLQSVAREVRHTATQRRIATEG